MKQSWHLSAAVEDLLTRVIADSAFADRLRDHHPSIMWSEGGFAESPGKPTIPIPPRYALGLVRNENLTSFKTIPSGRFGQIVFHPRPEDEASTRRTIDYDGTDIVVR